MVMAHENKHPLAGTDVVLVCEGATTSPVHIDDWLDRITTREMPTALATRTALAALWDGDECLVYGHIGSLGVIAHAADLGYVVPEHTTAADLLALWEAS